MVVSHHGPVATEQPNVLSQILSFAVDTAELHGRSPHAVDGKSLLPIDGGHVLSSNALPVLGPFFPIFSSSEEMHVLRWRRLGKARFSYDCPHACIHSYLCPIGRMRDERTLHKSVGAEDENGGHR